MDLFKAFCIFWYLLASAGFSLPFSLSIKACFSFGNSRRLSPPRKKTQHNPQLRLAGAGLTK